MPDATADADPRDDGSFGWRPAPHRDASIEFTAEQVAAQRDAVHGAVVAVADRIAAEAGSSAAAAPVTVQRLAGALIRLRAVALGRVGDPMWADDEPWLDTDDDPDS